MAENRKVLWLFVVPAVVVAGAAAVVYFLMFNRESPEELRLDTPPTAAAPAADIDFAGSWSITQGSVAGYRVREKLARLPASSDAVGRTSDIKGGFKVAEQGGELIASDMKVEVNMAALESDEDRRDSRLKTSGLETNRFPTATFVSTQPVSIPISDAKSGRANVSVTGDLTLHGVTKQVTIPLDVQLSGSRIEVAGAKLIVMADYGITPPSVAGIVTVESTGTLELKLVLAKA